MFQESPSFSCTSSTRIPLSRQRPLLLLEWLLLLLLLLLLGGSWSSWS
jgi:hypothetical protein